MEEMLKKTLAEKALIEHLRKVGIKGYYVDEVDEGLYYRFLDMQGKWHEFINLSTFGRKKLKID